MKKRAYVSLSTLMFPFVERTDVPSRGHHSVFCPAHCIAASSPRSHCGVRNRENSHATHMPSVDADDEHYATSCMVGTIVDQSEKSTHFLFDRDGTRHQQQLHIFRDDGYSELALRLQVAAV